MELYVMRRESGIYKYCLIEEAPIPLHMTSSSAIYPLIHTLMTLRTAVTSTIHKILYNTDSGYSEHSSGEMTITVLTPKNYRIEFDFMYIIINKKFFLTKSRDIKTVNDRTNIYSCVVYIE
jgi:hypothetical protein